SGREGGQMWLIGRLHPMLVHFPIGMILAAAGAEIIAIRTGRAAWRAAAVVNARVGAAMGAVTTAAGWALASAPFVDPGPLLTWHRWAGLAGATAAMGAALASAWPPVESRRSVLVYRVALFGAAALVAVAGHLGGSLVWGADFLRP